MHVLIRWGVYWPRQDMASLSSLKPVRQSQLWEPFVLTHSWAHPPFFELHSFISEKAERTETWHYCSVHPTTKYLKKSKVLVFWWKFSIRTSTTLALIRLQNLSMYFCSSIIQGVLKKQKNKQKTNKKNSWGQRIWLWKELKGAHQENCIPNLAKFIKSEHI